MDSRVQDAQRLQEVEFSNRRSHPRQKTFLAGRAVTNNGCSTVDLTIKNVSDGGALLQLFELIPMPDEFELVCKLFTRPVRVVWRRGRFIGVEFD